MKYLTVRRNKNGEPNKTDFYIMSSLKLKLTL